MNTVYDLHFLRNSPASEQKIRDFIFELEGKHVQVFSDFEFRIETKFDTEYDRFIVPAGKGKLSLSKSNETVHSKICYTSKDHLYTNYKASYDEIDEGTECLNIALVDARKLDQIIHFFTSNRNVAGFFIFPGKRNPFWYDDKENPGSRIGIVFAGGIGKPRTCPEKHVRPDFWRFIKRNWYRPSILFRYFSIYNKVTEIYFSKK